MAKSERSWLRYSALVLLRIVPLAGCDLCANDVLARYRAPDNSVEVVVFERDCGATTDFSTQASIGEINAGIRNQSGNIFIATTGHGRAPAGKGGGPELRIRWIDKRTVELAYHRAAYVSKRTEHHGGITVRYVTFE